MSLWQKIKDKISPPKPTVTVTTTTPAVVSASPSSTIGKPTITQVTPSQTTTTYSGSVSGYRPTSSGGGGGGSSSSSSVQAVQGPLPQGTTPSQEAEFRATGSVSTPIIKPASTSATQVQQPKAINIAGPLSAMAGTYKTSKWDATKESTKNIGLNIAGSFGFGSRADDPNKGWRETFAPFGSTGTEKSEKVDTSQISGYVPRFGTIQTTGVNMETGRLIQTGAFNTKTFLDVQKGVEQKDMFKELELTRFYQSTISSALPSYQARVDAGEDLNKVSREFEDFQKQQSQQLNKEFGEFKATNPDVRGFTTRSGQGLVTGIPAVLKTGALVGASALGGPALWVATAYTAGQGFKQTVEAENWAERVLGITTIGLAGYGVKASVLGIEKSIVAGQLADLSKQPIKFKQIQIQQGDRSIVGIEAIQKQGGLTRTISGRGIVFKEGENVFVLPKGNLKMTTTGELSWNLFGPSKTVIFSEQTGTFGAKSAFKQVGEFTFSAGKSTFVPKTSMSAIYGLDTSKNLIKGYSTNVKLGGDLITSSSFVSSKGIKPDVYGNEQFFSSGFGIKDSRVVAPAQFGKTTIYSGQNLPKFGGGLADDVLDGSTRFFRGAGNKGNIIKDLYGKETIQTTQLGGLMQGSKIDSGLNLGALSQSATQSMGQSLAMPKTAIVPVSLTALTKTQPKTQTLVMEQVSLKPATMPLTMIGSQTITKTKTKTISASGFKTAPLTQELSMTKPLVQTMALSKMATKQSQLLKTMKPSVLASPLSTTSFGFGIGSGFKVPFTLPKLPFGTDSSGGLGKIKASRTYRYTPSFGALALKGQKFKVGKTTSKRFTGLEYRGVTEKTKSTKSKRRKNKHGI